MDIVDRVQTGATCVRLQRPRIIPRLFDGKRKTQQGIWFD